MKHDIINRIFESLDFNEITDHSSLEIFIKNFEKHIHKYMTDMDEGTQSTLAIKSCEYALKGLAPNIFLKLNDKQNIYSDFVILGQPENLFISVEGFNNITGINSKQKKPNFSPTIAWEPFLKADQLSLPKIYSLMDQAILKIYLSKNEYDKLSDDLIACINTNRKSFVRALTDIVDDLSCALENQMIDIYKI
jgi:hypothetical protein